MSAVTALMIEVKLSIPVTGGLQALGEHTFSNVHHMHLPSVRMVNSAQK